ncbi:MAG: hypothetical protein ACE5I1_27205, partial [bacterium]
WGSYSKHVIERVQEAGYQCAFRLTHQTNYTGQNLFEINRIDAGYLTLNNAFHEGIMSTELAGMNQFLRSMRQKILPSTEQFTH